MCFNCAANPFVFGAKTNRKWFAAWFGALPRVVRSSCLQLVLTSWTCVEPCVFRVALLLQRANLYRSLPIDRVLADCRMLITAWDTLIWREAVLPTPTKKRKENLIKWHLKTHIFRLGSSSFPSWRFAALLAPQTNPTGPCLRIGHR